MRAWVVEQLLHRIISKASGEGPGTNADGKRGHFRSITKTMGDGMSLDVDSQSWKLVPVK